MTKTETANPVKKAKVVAFAAAAAAAPERWLTVGEAAEIAGMKPNTMYTCCLRRLLPSYKIGEKMRRIKESDLIAWMESGRVEAAGPTPLRRMCHEARYPTYPPELTPGRLLRINQFIPHILPIAKSTFWKKVKSGEYPPATKLSSKITCWKSEDIIALLNNKYQPEVHRAV